jgi:prepilin-type N-terminal cleavage/methylation domain-containing protein
MFPAFQRRRRGLTLIELLAVVAIMVILISVAIPLIRPLLENRKSREASRQLNAYFVGAQARATQLQRPVGVWIKRRGTRSPANAESFELFMAEAPPPYSGDTFSARCWIQQNPNYPVGASNPASNARHARAYFNRKGVNDSLLLFSPPGSLNPGQTYFVQIGDLIRFDYRGPLYEIENINRAGSPYYVDFRVPVGYPYVEIAKTSPMPPVGMPALGAHPGLAYQIYRREIRSSVNALTLPETVTIDLSVSGIGLGVGAASFSPVYATPPSPNSTPIVIMFHPRGGIDSVRIGNAAPFKPQEPIYLLVGQADKVAPPYGEAGDPPSTVPKQKPIGPAANLADLTNLWVKINHRTGAVTTSENAAFKANPSLGVDAKVANAIQQARAIARQGDSMGGL